MGVNNQSGRRSIPWLGCGIVVLIVACLGTVVALGGFTTFLAWIGANVEETPVVASLPTAAPADATLAPTAEIPSNSPIPFDAVVQIWAMADFGNGLEVIWTGSGSIISPDGYILTNAHVVLPDRYYDVDALGVALTVEQDQAPQPSFYAEVLQADQGLDIAVIRVVTDFDGNPVDYNSLNLPTVPLGNADTLNLGDDITIIGYPTIGGQTITLTRGEVSGFTSEDPYGDRAFIKTSATIAGGNSGGLAATPEGQLIGVPTQLGYGGDDQYVDCRPLADTNRDGIVDENDSCVPTGGFINALRPINLALPLIEAAKRGEKSIVDSSVPGGEEGLPEESSNVLFSDDFSDPNSGWGVNSTDAGSNQYVNGTLQFEVLNEKWLFWSTAGQDFSDTIISVQVDVLSATGEGDFGIICRYQDNGNYYAFEITEDGYYSIWKYVNEEFTPLIDWEESNYLTAGKSSYIVAAACVGDRLVIAADGNILAEITDDSIGSGDVGLITGTWEQTGLVVSFDDYLVTQPQ